VFLDSLEHLVYNDCPSRPDRPARPSGKASVATVQSVMDRAIYETRARGRHSRALVLDVAQAADGLRRFTAFDANEDHVTATRRLLRDRWDACTESRHEFTGANTHVVFHALGEQCSTCTAEMHTTRDGISAGFKARRSGDEAKALPDYAAKLLAKVGGATAAVLTAMWRYEKTEVSWLVGMCLLELGEITHFTFTDKPRDYGVDLITTLPSGQLQLVQVKGLLASKVGPGPAREFAGVKEGHESKRLVTTGLFTDGGRNVLNDPVTSIAALDGTVIASLLAEKSKASLDAVLGAVENPEVLFARIDALLADRQCAALAADSTRPYDFSPSKAMQELGHMCETCWHRHHVTLRAAA